LEVEVEDSMELREVRNDFMSYCYLVELTTQVMVLLPVHTFLEAQERSLETVLEYQKVC
jgi:hypothetical protein